MPSFNQDKVVKQKEEEEEEEVNRWRYFYQKREKEARIFFTRTDKKVKTSSPPCHPVH